MNQTHFKLTRMLELDFTTQSPDTHRMKHSLSALSIAALLAVLIAPAPAFAASKWKGKSTNMTGNFNYGPVSFTVQGNRIKNFLIEGVTTSGCNGYKNVFVPSGIKIKGTRFSGAYQPIPGIDDIITVSGRIVGSKATGTFVEGPLCSNAGKFVATRR